MEGVGPAGVEPALAYDHVVGNAGERAMGHAGDRDHVGPALLGLFGGRVGVKGAAAAGKDDERGTRQSPVAAGGEELAAVNRVGIEVGEGAEGGSRGHGHELGGTQPGSNDAGQSALFDFGGDFAGLRGNGLEGIGQGLGRTHDVAVEVEGVRRLGRGPERNVHERQFAGALQRPLPAGVQPVPLLARLLAGLLADLAFADLGLARLALADLALAHSHLFRHARLLSPCLPALYLNLKGT